MILRRGRQFCISCEFNVPDGMREMFEELLQDTRSGYLIYDEDGIYEEEEE